MTVTNVYKSDNSVTNSPWRYIRRLEAERQESAIQHREKLRAAGLWGQGVDNVHDLHSHALPKFVIRRIDGNEFSQLNTDLSQARQNRLAFRAHVSSSQKNSQLSTIKTVVEFVTGSAAVAALIMAGPILQALGFLKG